MELSLSVVQLLVVSTESFPIELVDILPDLEGTGIP